MPFQENESKQLMHILYIEDSDADADLVSAALKSLSMPKFILSREIRLQDALVYLQAQRVDVVLLDLNLPDSQGFETVVNFLAQAPSLPVIVLTGTDDKELGMRAVEEGAQDYLVKGQFDAKLLPRVILYSIERKVNLLKLEEALVRERLAHEEAEKAIALRDEFLSIASHEFRTPLSVLKMQVDLLIRFFQENKKNALFGDSLQMAEMADRQISRFLHLVEKLFDYSQIQSGHLIINYSSFDLNKVIRESVDLLDSELKKVGCEVVLNLGEPIIGEWDQLRLEQVFANLLSNTIKYAPGKPLEILVSSDMDSVWIRFKDRGPGIQGKDKDLIFQPYERLEKGNAISGLGLGLYVVRQIINAHGGTIKIEDDSKVGATFIIHLPKKPKKAFLKKE